MFHVKLFGYPRLFDGDIELKIPRKKSLALLAYLIATKRAYSRDTLTGVLWLNHMTSDARAELRRMLYALNKTPLSELIVTEGDMVSLQSAHDGLVVDLWQFDDAMTLQDWDRLQDNLQHWKLPFLDGFTLEDEANFDLWRTQVDNQKRYTLTNQLEQIVNHALLQHHYDAAIPLLQTLIEIEMFNEAHHRQLMYCYMQQNRRQNARDQYQLLQKFLHSMDDTPEPETIAMAEAIEKNELSPALTQERGFLPPVPEIIVGREALLADLKTALANAQNAEGPSALILQGVPGVGKTTLTAHLSHDMMMHERFSDGVLWASLGQSPNILGILQEWGAALGIERIAQAKDSQTASDILRNHLTDARALIIVDDIWNAQHLIPFKIGGTHAAMLITTRLNQIAQTVALHPDQIIKVPILAHDASLGLLTAIIPSIVEAYPQEIDALIDDLEGLPLALRVAGRLLRDEQQYGWDIGTLLAELREGKRLLEAQAPLDRQEAEQSMSTSVAALLQLSTDSLDDLTRQRFALLGVFAPKPAVFEMDAVGAVWQTDDPRPTIRQLVGRGLLDVVPPNQLQMHALLVRHARSMFDGAAPP